MSKSLLLAPSWITVSSSFKQMQDDILHQPLGVSTCVGGYPRKLGFLGGREVFFHRL